MSTTSFLPAKRRRGGEGGEDDHLARARLVMEREPTDIADLAQIGMLPEEVTLALQERGRGDSSTAVLAGVDGRMGRAYALVGNTLYTWQLEPAESGNVLEPPADRSLELLDRQGYACVTPATPAVAVLAPLAPRMPVAVVLANGRLVWRELERGGAKSEYTAQLEAGEEVTTATWEVVGGNLAEFAAAVQVMAFLGTTHGRVYRVGPLGAGGGGSGLGAISSGPMARPGGLTDYLPWRLRGPGPLESVRSLLVWEEGKRNQRTRRVMTLTGDSVHLYDASGSIGTQFKLLDQLRALSGDEAVSLVGAALVRPGVVMVAATVGTQGPSLSLFLLDLRGDHSTTTPEAVPLMDVDLVSPDVTVEDVLLRTRLEASRGNTSQDAVAYIVHPSKPHEDGRVTVLHFRLGGAGHQLRAEDLQSMDLPVARVVGGPEGGGGGGGGGLPAMGGVLGAGMLLRTDMLVLLAGPDRVLRVRALRHAGTTTEPDTLAAADEQRSWEVAEKVRRAFKLYMDLQPAQAQAVVVAEGLLDLPDGLPELAAGFQQAIWQEVDLEPDIAPYWGGGAESQQHHQQEQQQSSQDAFHLLVQHSLRRKLAAAERWLRFLAETGLWAKLTETQAAALLEGAERLAACEQLCAALLPGGEEAGARGMPAALGELLRGHAMKRWGEDLPAQVRSRLEAGGLPPLDLFLANPSQVARKLGSLQAARKEYMRRTAPPVPKKDQMEASLAITTVLWRALDAAMAERTRLQEEYGVLRPSAGLGGWLTEDGTLQVMEEEVKRLQEMVQQDAAGLTAAHLAVIGDKARQLGALWLRLGTLGGRWQAEEARTKKRLAVECVEAYGLVAEALTLARQARAWDVLGELEFRHREWRPQALTEDMARHPEVAAHVLGWLLDQAELDHVLEYGNSSALARSELEKLFVTRPDCPAAARLAWMHHVRAQAFGRATEDFKALAEEENTLDMKTLWVDLGVLSDEAARRHLRGQVAEEATRLALKEEQCLFHAQARLGQLLQLQPQREASHSSSVTKLKQGEAIGPEDTIRVLIQHMTTHRGLPRPEAVRLALMAMGLLDYYGGRRQEIEASAVKRHVESLWTALIRREQDWEGVWSECGTRDPGRAVETTAFAQAVQGYMRPRGGEGQRSDYPERVATPSDAVLEAVVQGLLSTLKYKPQHNALLTALARTRNTV